MLVEGLTDLLNAYTDTPFKPATKYEVAFSPHNGRLEFAIDYALYVGTSFQNVALYVRFQCENGYSGTSVNEENYLEGYYSS